MFRALRTFVLRCLGAAPQGSNVVEDSLVLKATIRRFQGQTRPRWGVRLPFLDGAPEGYGATLRQALEAVAEGVQADDEQQAREVFAALEPKAAGPLAGSEAGGHNPNAVRSLRSGLERDGDK